MLWEVICGNVGVMYSGLDEHLARKTFDETVKLSKESNGRIKGESVYLMKGGMLTQEHLGEEASAFLNI